MVCFCSVYLRVELCCVRCPVCSPWLWHLKLGELQGSGEYSEEDHRCLCSGYGVKLGVIVVMARARDTFHLLDTGCVAHGTCVNYAGINEDMWWFTGDTADCLGYFLSLVGQHGLISDYVPDVVGFRGCHDGENLFNFRSAHVHFGRHMWFTSSLTVVMTNVLLMVKSILFQTGRL